MEQLVCIWVGVVFVFSLADGHVSWSFTIVALLAVVASRAVTVFPLSRAVNFVLKLNGRPEAANVPMEHSMMVRRRTLRLVALRPWKS